MKKSKDSLGDRIKGYEKTFMHSAVKRMPLMIRVDGRAFHTLTRNLPPFDPNFMDAMESAARDTAKDMQGFKAAYVQSDEVTFWLTDYDSLETEGWFKYKLPKVISISAATMSVTFNEAFTIPVGGTLPVFDSRAFTVPKEEVVNTFLWRAKDWERNSLQMYCRTFFSHKQLHKKNKASLHEMLHSIGKNWVNDLSDRERNGTFLLRSGRNIVHTYTVKPTYESINDVIGGL